MGQTTIFKTLLKTKDRAIQIPLNPGSQHIPFSRQIVHKRCDKRVDLYFPIVNIPFLGL